jgi:multidrug efflux pump subunit AcrB
VRLPDEERRSVADLESLLIATPAGVDVPFREVAEIELGRSYAQIMHQDNHRRVRVFADIDERHANAEYILKTLESGFLQEVVGEYAGMSFVLGGDRHAVEESMSSLSKGFWIGMIVMYAMLAAMLRSYLQPMVIFLTVPFGFIGAVIGHLALGYDLTMMSLFGLVALSGIVVDHAIIVLDAVRESMKLGKGLMESIFEAGESRFNAVILSAITDVAGLFPLLSLPHGQAQSVMPMAIAFSFGLVFSALVTLFLVPAVFVALNDARRFARWIWRGGAYPTAEMLEGVEGQTAVQGN